VRAKFFFFDETKGVILSDFNGIVKLIKSSFIDRALLAFILLAGIILRFYNYGEAPLIHDEISTLLRSGYSSFEELIEKGVKEDVHPPGLIIFVHYWVKLFGDSAQALKLPFVFASLFSIIVAYKIAQQWFNATTALLTAVILSASQYTLTYSLIARPYALGMLFSLMLVYCQWNYFVGAKRRNIWLAGFVISGIACIYLHYFSLLFTAFVAVTGFFIGKKRALRHYFFACLVIALSFIPFLPIFFSHLNYGSGEQSWIGKPGIGFIVRYALYLNHFSWWYFCVLILLLLLPFILKKTHSTVSKKYRAFCLIFFSGPFIVGYFFSVLVYPVLQFSGLLFGFAFLPMFLFSWIEDLKPKWKFVSVGFLMLVSILTLVFERKHFELFYNQGINKIVEEIKSSKQITGKDSCETYINIENYFTDYYSKKTADLSAKFISVTNGKDVKSFQKQLRACNKKYVAFGTVTTFPTEILAVIQNEYPYLIKEYKGLLTEFYLYSKEKEGDGAIDNVIFISEPDFIAKNSGSYNTALVSTDSLRGKHYLNVRRDSVLLFSIPIKSIVEKYSDIVTVSILVFMEGAAPSAVLELQTEYKGITLDKKFVHLSDYNQWEEWSEAFLSVRLTDISISFKRAELKVKMINPNNVPIKISDFKVVVEKGNPYLYGQSYH
jgi:uncharacterized membrane protein